MGEEWKGGCYITCLERVKKAPDFCIFYLQPSSRTLLSWNIYSGVSLHFLVYGHDASLISNTTVPRRVSVWVLAFINQRRDSDSLLLCFPYGSVSIIVGSGVWVPTQISGPETRGEYKVFPPGASHSTVGAEKTEETETDKTIEVGDQCWRDRGGKWIENHWGAGGGPMLFLVLGNASPVLECWPRFLRENAGNAMT